MKEARITLGRGIGACSRPCKSVSCMYESERSVWEEVGKCS